MKPCIALGTGGVIHLLTHTLVNSIYTLHLRHFFARSAHSLHSMACPHGSNLTSTGASHKKHSSIEVVAAATVAAAAAAPTGGGWRGKEKERRVPCE